jgi:hypothetical protein
VHEAVFALQLPAQLADERTRLHTSHPGDDLCREVLAFDAGNRQGLEQLVAEAADALLDDALDPSREPPPLQVRALDPASIAFAHQIAALLE